VLAFVFRNGLFGGIYIKLTIIALVVLVSTKALVTIWLGFWSVALARSVAAGVESSTVVGLVLLTSGLFAVSILIVFLFSSGKLIAEIKSARKGGAIGAPLTQGDAGYRPPPRVTPLENPAYTSTPSPSVMEKGKSYIERGKQVATRTSDIYNSGKDKVQKANDVARKVVLISTAVEGGAAVVGVAFAGVPYVAPVSAGVVAVARGANAIASKAERSSNAVLHPVQTLSDRNDRRTPPPEQ
jgi:hypothetical protein